MFRHDELEKKWQKKWETDKIYQADDRSDKKKFFCLDMFPYPSGAGLHVGHVEGYAATDIYSRYMRARGYEVLHPMGWDAFGLPAENFAIKEKVHPRETTQKSIERFKFQLHKTGLSYDWNREIDTSSPAYYRWTQWLFLLFYRNGLAYRKKAPVNWCPSCRTVLANEQVIKRDDKNVCERCDSEVVQKDLEQWFLRITKYAQELIDGLDRVEWPESTRTAQKNWIGKQGGLNLLWKVDGRDTLIKTFTKFPETIFGASFITIAPEYPGIWDIVTAGHVPEVEKYTELAKKKTALQRTELQKDKTGVFTGSYVVNSVNGEKLPVWVADYVLADYGTGAVFGCPAHDMRDFHFAQKYKLAIKRVIKSIEGDESDVTNESQIIEDGTIINSGFLNGLSARSEAKERIMDEAEKKGFGERVTFYNLKDWLVSRQRYWGAPIPVVYCPHCGKEEDGSHGCCGGDCGCDHNGECDHGGDLDFTEINGKKHAIVPLSEEDLPVLLPDDVDFLPTGESPLTRSKSFHEVKCPRCGATEGVRREVDTLDTFVDSSWYFFRFADPKSTSEFASRELLKKWLPVDLYVGGDHATTHLIYARFFTKVLCDLGLIDFDEPFLKMRYIGLILGEDGRKMSKRWGNIVNPDDVVEAFGADTLRTYEMFMGPLEVSKTWSTSGVEGVRRFYNRVWELSLNTIKSGRGDSPREVLVQAHKLIKNVSEDIEAMKFNTAIAFLMGFVNFWQKNGEGFGKDVLKIFIRLVSPFAPHMASELWERVGEKDTLDLETWPSFDPSLVEDEVVEIPVQVNGKLKAKVEVRVDRLSDRDFVENMALGSEKVRAFLKGRKVKRFIYVERKIANVII